MKHCHYLCINLWFKGRIRLGKVRNIMKSTGVVRRIDDLGRVVIPKEIRKSLRIKDGESLEIFLDRDNIILRKFSHLDNLADFYKSYVEAIHGVIGKNVIIVDRDKVVAVSGDLKKKYLDKAISNKVDEMIQKRMLLTVTEPTDFSLSTGLTENASYCFSPIIINGDAIGAVIILSNDEKITDFDEKTAVIATNFLSKYIE